MLNYLWGFMIVIGIIYAAFTGKLPDVTNAALNSSKEAVTLCITMLGVMSLWVGLMRIAENCGIISSATKMLNPLLRFMFPKIPKGHKANEYISTNIIANEPAIIGLNKKTFNEKALFSPIFFISPDFLYLDKVTLQIWSKTIPIYINYNINVLVHKTKFGLLVSRFLGNWQHESTRVWEGSSQIF